jgi:phosphatidylglycerophosphate synthase
MLRLPDDIVLTPSLFEHLPPEGTWHVAWHPERPPLAWQGAGTIGPPVPVAVPDGSALDVSSPGARRAAAWGLLRQSGKPTDGWLARHVHRRMSRVVSYVLLQLGLTAAHAMLVPAAVGLASAWLLAQTSQQTLIAGALLLWFSAVTGGIDGEMARVSLSDSTHGQQLDTLLYHATRVLCYAGVMVGWWRQGMSAHGAALAFGVALALPATRLLAMHMVRNASGAPHLLVETRPIELALLDAAHATGSWILRVAAAIFVLFRRESYPLAFVAVSLVTGSRAVFAAIVAVALSLVLLTFLFYARPIEDRMRHRFAS